MEDKESKRTQFLSDKDNKKINLTLAELLFIDDNSTTHNNNSTTICFNLWAINTTSNSLYKFNKK